jgi:TetR/AcrR family transcriptional regulator
MPPPSAVARAQQARATRDVILDAAERRFGERGFAGVSMRELAAEAGLRNQASLYNHFRNKRALYEAVLARGMDPIIAVIAASGDAQRASSSTTPVAFLDAMIDYLIEHPHLPRLIQRAALDDSRHLRHVLTRHLRPLYREGIGVLAAMGGAWDPAELPHLAAGLYQLIFGYFANAPLLATVTDDPLTPAAVERQRIFLKKAMTRLLALAPAPTRGATRKRKLPR